ncbi:DNA pilot protein [Microviridae sp.]|nr:DNA pilot protein [Microviridae sp.]
MMTRRYQYMVQDLEEAGLNKMLAIGNAQPPHASVQTGATGGSQKQDPLAFSAIRVNRSTEDKNRADAVKSRATTGRELATTGLLNEQTNKAVAETESAIAQAQLLQSQLPGARAVADFERDYPNAAIALKYLTPAVGAASSMVREIRRGPPTGWTERKPGKNTTPRRRR